MWTYLLFPAAYLLGAVPVGYLVARSRGVDITKVGSGNIGATNVNRVLGKGWALAVFLLDVSKGLVPALAGSAVFETNRAEQSLALGMLAVLGHSASPFLGFKGGKGVATGLGALLGSAAVVGASGLAVFTVMLLAFGYVSLASIAAGCSLPIFGLIYGQPQTIVLAYVGLAAFVVWRHRANIRRLRDRTEPKFRLKNDATPKAIVENPQESGSPNDESERGDVAIGADAEGRARQTKS